MPTRNEIEKIKQLGLRESTIIKDTISDLKRKLHLKNSDINKMFPDLMKAKEKERNENMQRDIIKSLKKFIY